MAHFYHWIRALFKRKRRLTLSDIPHLPSEVLARIHTEAGLLRQGHAVEVASLAEGEEPGMPRAVDAQVEAKLSAARAEDTAASASSAPSPISG